MPGHIAIAASSYILRRGLQAIIEDFTEVPLLFPETLRKLNALLDEQVLRAVIIDTTLLNDQHQIELLFRLKHCPFIGILFTKTQSNYRFDSTLEANAPKYQLVSTLQTALHDTIAPNSDEHNILSQREQEVLKHIAMGYTHQEIADQLNLSRHTVISHRKNISARLGIKTVSGLTLYAALHKLIPGDPTP